MAVATETRLLLTAAIAEAAALQDAAAVAKATAALSAHDAGNDGRAVALCWPQLPRQFLGRVQAAQDASAGGSLGAAAHSTNVNEHHSHADALAAAARAGHQ